MDLSSDQHVWLLFTKVTDKARDRTRHPIGTEAVNSHLCWQPRRRWIGTIAEDSRLNPTGLGETQSESTGRIAVRSLARAANQKSQAVPHAPPYTVVAKCIEAISYELPDDLQLTSWTNTSLGFPSIANEPTRMSGVVRVVPLGLDQRERGVGEHGVMAPRGTALFGLAGPCCLGPSRGE